MSERDHAIHAYVAIVEDDESLRRSLARLLRVSGLNAIAYPSAEAFMADERRPAFDCLILDIQLEGVSGVELNEHLAARGITTPVIFLTAHPGPAMREQALRTPCVAYLRKTESSDVVLSAVWSAIRAHRSSASQHY